MEILSQHSLTALQARINRKMAASAENHFATLKDQVNKFRQHLARNKDNFLHILSTYQSYATSEDEFHRIFECLDAIDEVREYLTRRTRSVAVFFPLNMPIYALILYGVFPALVADNVYVRAPQRMTDLMHQLEPLLDFQQHFPNLNIVFASREEFVQNYVISADVIIFTGKLANAQQVLRNCKKDSLFLFNGWGCNPIVVGEGANLDSAAEKTIQARLFSSGQDCAGPDTVLVSKQDMDAFVRKLKDKLARTIVGQYSNRNVTVGPLADAEQIRMIGSMFSRASDNIVHGGVIDYSAMIVHPTIMVSDLRQRTNFEELFAPVIFVSVYDDESQLSQYFEHPSYKANEMYITLFGSCDYVHTLKKSIIVRDQVIFDIDRGNDEFGGYSVGASFVASNRRITAKPILVPREIHDYLQPGSSGYKLSPSSQIKIGKQVRKAMTDFFASNLVFGFVFGSVARQQATGSSDINTMIVLEEKDDGNTNRYMSWLRHLHEQYQLTFKEQLSAIVLTLSELNQLVAQLDSSGKAGPCITGTTKANALIPTEALSGTQCGVSGNKKLSVEYGRRVMPYSTSIRKKKPVDPDPKLEQCSPQVPAQVKAKTSMFEEEKKVADSISSSETATETETTTPSIIISSSTSKATNTTTPTSNSLPRQLPTTEVDTTQSAKCKSNKWSRMRNWCRRFASISIPRIRQAC